MNNLSAGAKEAYDNVSQRGYTPQQALAYAQDYDGIASPISPMSAGAPSVRELTPEDFAPVDLSGIANVGDLSIDVAPATRQANSDVARLNARQSAGDVPFYLDRNSANPGSLSITVTGGRIAASQAEFDAYIGGTGAAGSPAGVNPPVDNTTLGSALRDTGRAFVNAGTDVVEGVPNLLSGALPGFPDYVPFMQNLRLPYDTPAFGVTLEVLSGFGAAKAFSLAAEGAAVGEATNVFHATTSPGVANSILTKGIDPAFLNPDSRFGPAFYVAEAPETALAELAHHGATPTTGIRFELNADGARTLDLTVPEVSEAYGYRGGPISSETQAIGARALDEGFNVIKYNSLRGSGANYAVLDNFNEVLRAYGVSPIK